MSTPIVVAIDFSQSTELIMGHALCIARSTGADISLLHVAEIPHMPVGIPESMMSAAEEFRHILVERLEEAREQLEEIRQRYRGQGPSISLGVKEGFPDAALSSAAVELGASMIIVGTHNRTGFERFWLGSVSRKLIRVCDRDVLVIREPAPHIGGYKNILVATGLEGDGDSLLDRAASVAAEDATIELFHTVDVGPAFGMDTMSGGAADVVNALTDQSRRELEALGETARKRGLKVAVELGSGRASKAIVARLEDGNYDLVITGSHGRRGVQRALLGSIAEGIVLGAPCSALVVKSSE